MHPDTVPVRARELSSESAVAALACQMVRVRWSNRCWTLASNLLRRARAHASVRACARVVILWSNRARALVKSCACTGQIVRVHWSNRARALVKSCACTGQIVRVHWSNRARALVKSCACTGQIVRVHWSNRARALLSHRSQTRAHARFDQGVKSWAAGPAGYGRGGAPKQYDHLNHRSNHLMSGQII